MGRPSDYTPEIAEMICARLADGASLRQICEADEMPNRSTVLRWLSADADFATKYACAREHQADAMDDKILQVADDCTTENAAAARVKIDAYKWRASKLAPKKYGDKVAVTGGTEDDAPVRVDVTDRDRAKGVAALIAKAMKDQKRGEG